MYQTFQLEWVLIFSVQNEAFGQILQVDSVPVDPHCASILKESVGKAEVYSMQFGCGPSGGRKL